MIEHVLSSSYYQGLFILKILLWGGGSRIFSRAKKGSLVQTFAQKQVPPSDFGVKIINLLNT